MLRQTTLPTSDRNPAKVSEIPLKTTGPPTKIQQKCRRYPLKQQDLRQKSRKSVGGTPKNNSYQIETVIFPNRLTHNNLPEIPVRGPHSRITEMATTAIEMLSNCCQI